MRNGSFHSARDCVAEMMVVGEESDQPPERPEQHFYRPDIDVRAWALDKRTWRVVLGDRAKSGWRSFPICSRTSTMSFSVLPDIRRAFNPNAKR